MPNWCSNVLEISHKDPVRSAELRRIVTDIQQAENFSAPFLQALIPCPYDEFEALDRLNDYPEKFEEYRQGLIERYGASDWYSWCNANWGTKWDLNIYSVDESPWGFTICFDSAWAPPIEAYQDLTTRGYAIRGYYNEPGMSFCGIWSSGEGDLYIEYSSDDVSNVPDVLVEMFDIAAWSDDFEEEQE